jgi:hypothetical protein
VSEIRGLEYKPAKDGFVFSNTEIPGLGNGFHKIQTQKISNASRFNEGITRRFKAQNRSIMLGGFLRPIMERFADRTKMLA